MVMIEFSQRSDGITAVKISADDLAVAKALLGAAEKIEPVGLPFHQEILGSLGKTLGALHVANDVAEFTLNQQQLREFYRLSSSAVNNPQTHEIDVGAASVIKETLRTYIYSVTPELQALSSAQRANIKDTVDRHIDTLDALAKS